MLASRRSARLFPFALAALTISATAILGLPGVAVSASDDAPPIVEVTTEPETPLERLALEVAELRDLVRDLRFQLARAHGDAIQARRELKEMEQFIADHREYGTDFEAYRGVVEVAEREARRRAAQERLAERDAKRAERARERAARSAERSARDAEEQKHDAYRQAGFAPLGLEVYGGRMAFYYAEKDNPGVEVEYDRWLGLYYRPDRRDAEIDYSTMSISGSVLNAAPEIRNIGVAMTFFDRHGNQVGSEIVRIDNARPNVPYPFNATITMALDRAFSTSSTYVLYADPIE